MLFAPDLVCLEALQEFVQARRMTRRTSDETDGQLKLIHAYYLGMMGLRYRTSAGHNVLWPSQYAYLLNHKLVRWEDRASWGLETKMIKDKNKADSLVKLAALWQVLWFVLNCITREAEGVPIAPLEAMTLAYVLIALITYGLWWKKPKDIVTASVVELPPLTELQRAAFDTFEMESTYDVRQEGEQPSRNAAWYLIARDYDDQRYEYLLHGNTLVSTSSGKPTATIEEIQLERPQGSLSRSKPLPRPCPNNQASEVITEWDSSLYMSRW